jgi:glycerol-3-phosphate dehydrogenase
LVLDARAAMDMAPKVAHLMARALKYDEDWQTRQVDSFVRLAKNYL